MKVQLRRAARTAGDRAGFTLIECSIAILLMVFGVLTAFYSQITAVNLLRSLREHNAIVGDMESCMEQVMLQPIGTMTVAPSAFMPGQPVAAFNGLHLEGEQLVVTYPNMVGANVPDPLEIRVTATWNDWRGRPQNLFITTLKTR